MEEFRAKTRLGVDGEEELITIAELLDFLNQGLEVLEAIFSKGSPHRFLNARGIPYTYFINEATAYECIDAAEQIATDTQKPYLRAKAFAQRPLCLFLEGPVHYLKLFPEQALDIYYAVRSSELYDQKLKMFKVCASLRDQPYEIGRITAYATGWIENESIYTHMQYKWLLELLRSGQVEAFYEEMRNLLPPFMAPKVYGRSTLENCSFIVSSAFPDPDLHGRAFQPRLSGVTAEMLEMWSLMVAGPKPFRLDLKGRLQLILEPLLSSSLFTEKEGLYRYWDREAGWGGIYIPPNCFAFRFIGQSLVIYHNSGRKSTFGTRGASILGCTFTYRNGMELKENGPIFSDPQARAVRMGDVRRMDVFLG
ncbi:MAG: hypothetical protein A2Z14_00240 [Chloroflexi bacterium RBG_16_48_8]|nr:MAG: hypothetical protein A2Z14_00240 [Chloroflexi bacterium RBG_16_48_8]